MKFKLFTTQFIALSFFIISIFGNLNAQADRSRKFGLGVSVSPELNGGIFADARMKVKPGFGYSFGLDAHFSLGKHLLLRVGLSYAQRSYETRVDSVTISSWLFQPNPYGRMITKANYSELAIPLQFHYRFDKPFFVGGGVEVVLPSFGSKSETRLEHDDFNVEYFGSPYSVGNNIALTVSGGYTYNFGKELSLTLEPIFKIHMNPIPYSMKKDFYSLGLKCTFRWGAH